MKKNQTFLSALVVFGVLASPASAFGRLDAPASVTGSELVISVQSRALKKCGELLNKRSGQLRQARASGNQKKIERAELRYRKAFLQNKKCKTYRNTHSGFDARAQRIRDKCRRFARANGHQFFSKSLSYRDRNTGKVLVCSS